MSGAQDEQLKTAGPVRMTSADPAVVFARLDETGLVARGGVNIIGLDTVRDRLSDRWERRRGLVWEHVEAAAARRLGDGDLCLRLNDTDFAIAISGVEALAAQALCLRILREVLEHFLGACRVEDLVIRSVSSVQGGEISCIPLDPRSIRQVPEDAGPAVDRIRDKGSFHEQAFIMTSMGGRDLRLKHDFEPLLGISSRTPVATTLEPSVLDVASGRRIPGYAFARLSDPDLWAIDQLTLSVAEQAAAAGWPEPPLILPLAYGSVANSRGRARLVELLNASRNGVTVAIRNVEPGTPRGCLAELVGMLRRMEINVLVRVTPVRDALAAVELAKVNGVILDAEPLAAQPERLKDALRSFGRQAHTIAPILAVRGLVGAETLVQALAAGFTHWGGGADSLGDITLAA